MEEEQDVIRIEAAKTQADRAAEAWEWMHEAARTDICDNYLKDVDAYGKGVASCMVISTPSNKHDLRPFQETRVFFEEGKPVSVMRQEGVVRPHASVKPQRVIPYEEELVPIQRVSEGVSLRPIYMGEPEPLNTPNLISDDKAYLGAKVTLSFK